MENDLSVGWETKNTKQLKAQEKWKCRAITTFDRLIPNRCSFIPTLKPKGSRTKPAGWGSMKQ